MDTIALAAFLLLSKTRDRNHAYKVFLRSLNLLDRQAYWRSAGLAHSEPIFCIFAVAENEKVRSCRAKQRQGSEEKEVTMPLSGCKAP